MQNEISNLKKAIEVLNEGQCCVAYDGININTSKEFGIKPLMIFLRQDKSFFDGYSVADKVIGKAAALLLVLGKAKAVYGKVISESAIEILEQNSIYYEYGEKVEYIENRTKDGMCPMEQTVINISSPVDAFFALEKTIAKLMANKQ